MKHAACTECGLVMTCDDSTPSPPRWCSEACADKATANEPGWIRVADLTGTQRAELDAIVAPRGLPS